MSVRLLRDNVRTIVLYPYKIDKEGTVYIRAMVKSKCPKYKARMKRLVAMGMFSAEGLNIKGGKECG